MSAGGLGVIAVVAAVAVWRYWPWDWRGKRRYIKLKTRRKDWHG